MIEKQEFLTAKCDKCKEFFGSEDVSFFVFQDMKELTESLGSAGWDLAGNKVLCSECKAKKKLQRLVVG